MTDDFTLKLINDNVKYIRGKVDTLDEKFDKHERDCPALKWYNKKPDSSSTITPPKINKGSSLYWMKTLGPIILAAAIGLMGLGAALGGDDVEKIEKQVKTLSELVKKVDQ